MPVTTNSLRPLFAIVATGVALVSMSRSTYADLIAGDSFFVGTGGYSVGNLTGQPGNGFSPNSYGFSGSYGNGQTGFLMPHATGLSYNATGYSGSISGSIRMVSGSAVNGASRSLLRDIANSSSNPNVLYFSGLLQAPNALIPERGGFFEFSNRSKASDGATILGSGSEGFEFGIQGTTFVLRTVGGSVTETFTVPSYSPLFGTTAADTNLFILRLEINPTGDDQLTIFLNPTDVTSESAAAGSSAFSITLFDRDIASFGSDISSFGFRTLSKTEDTTNIFGDEVRMGTAFGDVVTQVVPEPATGILLLAGVGLLGGRRTRHNRSLM